LLSGCAVRVEPAVYPAPVAAYPGTVVYPPAYVSQPGVTFAPGGFYRFR